MPIPKRERMLAQPLIQLHLNRHHSTETRHI
jgi:hypothetical protein